jgi:spore maturation protein CgeB
MRIVMFCHSLESDWNHGNAHFLRGIATELLARGHELRVLEPRDGWSRDNLVRDHGEAAIEGFHRAYPSLSSGAYDESSLDLDAELGSADLVFVHEWNSPALVAQVGEHRAEHSYRLLFHDTHHRSVTDAASMAAYDLRHYDGVLAFGDAVRDRSLEAGWASRVWTWHEAADHRVFYPRTPVQRAIRDVVWIGNWGDGERSAELEAFLIEPIEELGLTATAYGVRYPPEAVERLARAGIEYGGWLPNHDVPVAFAQHRITVHVPRGPYLDQLPGIPTIRPFEALACGIPLVCARWDAAGGLFAPGADFLVARDPAEMRSHLRLLAADNSARHALKTRGLSTIRERHTCAHRVDELEAICGALDGELATTS